MELATVTQEFTSVPWFVYVGFIGFVIAMLFIDLKFFHAREEEPSMRQSAAWVTVWVSMAVAFGALLFVVRDTRSGAEYFAGYVIEYSLSVDNMFVFIVIFSYFRVPFAYQHQVLFYGILGAIVFRGIFIAIGFTLLERFEWVIFVFGGFLIVTAYRIARGHAEDVDPEHNAVLNLVRRRFAATHRFDGQKLFTIETGKRVATPLFITLIFIEMTDVVFALDSIPAIFGITRDPFIVLTSNVFAILGLRALYFLVAGALNRLHLLNYGLAIVLAFVGAKMLLTAADIEIDIFISLPVIVTVLAVTAVLSLKIPPKHERPPLSFPEPESLEQVSEH